MKRILALLLAVIMLLGLAGTAAASEVVLKVGDRTAYVNGTATTLASAPFIKDGLTFVPLRFMSEGLGAEVGWDGQTQTITVALGGDLPSPPTPPSPIQPGLPADLAPSTAFWDTGLEGVTLEPLDADEAMTLVADTMKRPEVSMLFGALEQEGFQFSHDAGTLAMGSDAVRATVAGGAAGAKTTVDIVNFRPASGPEGKHAVAVAALAQDGSAMFMGHVTDATPDAAFESLDSKTFRVDAWVVAPSNPHPYLVHWCYWWYDSHQHYNWFYSWYRWYWYYYHLYCIPWYPWYNWFFHWYHWNHWWYWCHLWPY